MKTISTALKTAIAVNGTIATCLKITRKDGVVIGFTNHDIALTVSGVTYTPLPALERIVMKLRNNIEVSNQEFVGAFVLNLDESDLNNGIYNESLIDVYYVDWTTPSNGTFTVFSGQLGNIQWNADGFRADIYNILQRLDINIGTIVTSKCRHVLFSQVNQSPWQVGSCKVNKTTFTNTGSVNGVTNKVTFTITGDAGLTGRATEFFTNGVLTWTSGSNNNDKYEIKQYTVAGSTRTVNLFLPTTYPIQVGDTFSISAGCDKTLTTCKNKFNNVINFGGFPFKGAQ
jgi:uncharacterized phage protein (TIGR02218 family)